MKIEREERLRESQAIQKQERVIRFACKICLRKCCFPLSFGLWFTLFVEGGLKKECSFPLRPSLDFGLEPSGVLGGDNKVHILSNVYRGC